jgi:hypothetical protein
MVLRDKTGKILSRSEGEAVMKGRGAITISIYAALLAICTLYSNATSSTVLGDTLKINDTYNFYQAKSIKQSLAEYEIDDAQARGDAKRAEELKAKIARYESDPATGEGKRELLTEAKRLERERDSAKAKGPYLSFASAALQIAIVLSSTAILAVSMEMLWASVAIGVLGALLLGNGIISWFAIPGL